MKRDADWWQSALRHVSGKAEEVPEPEKAGIMSKMKEGQRMTGRLQAVLEKVQKYLFPAILLLYPLRHIHWGLDLWDTGYNYANFQFMGTDHMDPMWLFSTYLATAVGSLLMKLPFADTLMGMNLYTSLTVSVLALWGYWFCTKKVGMPAGPVFLGEILAVSLCWCPTALLYNYLTYILFLGGCICLYLGLKEDRNGMLVAAGICLGINIFVRFSNLPEAAMILAVWAYGIICHRKVSKVAAQTGWCMLGYFGAVGIGLLYLGIRYGLDVYAESIMRLFGMTENASDYTAVAMVMKMVGGYLDLVYWIIRISVFVVTGLVLFALLPGRWIRLKKAGSFLLTAAALVWLYLREFCGIQFYDYNAMLRPGILFMILAMVIGVIVIFHPKMPREDKLLSGIVILIILLTSIGSNNGLFPSLNNLFLAGPFVFWMVWRFLQTSAVMWEMKRKWRLEISSFPLKAALVMILSMVLVQGIGFGAGFVFVEADGATDVEVQVENNRVLSGIYMSKERAQWMTEISTYVTEAGLEGREVLLYGWIPSLSYYLNMPPAFNSWSDLESYSLEAMVEDMQELEAQVDGGGEKPVVILEQEYSDYEEKAMMDPKMELIVSFMDQYDYKLTFRNEKFLLLEAE